MTQSAHSWSSVHSQGIDVTARDHDFLGNVSSGNQPLCANYGNFNLSHTMLIQRRDHGRWEGWCAKLIRGGRDDLQMHFCKSPLPPPMIPPLDQHRVAQIEVSIVCTEELVSTWYVPDFLKINIHTCVITNLVFLHVHSATSILVVLEFSESLTRYPLQ
jgi:hypothetical protein